MRQYWPVNLWNDWKHDVGGFARQDLPTIVLVLLEAAVLILVLRWITRRIGRYAKGHALPSGLRAQQLRTMAALATSAGTAVIVFTAVMQILDRVGINIGPLLASAGVAGLAIGIGAQTLVKDIINGFFILMENQYELGDVVRVGGVKGTVEAMTLRRTVLRDADGSLHTVPNSQVAIVSNLTRDWNQVALHVSVAYGEPSDRVISLLQQVARDIRNDRQFSEALVSDPEVPGIERVSGGEVDYLMLAKTRPSDQYRVSRELRRRIKECFERNNIRPAGPASVYVMDKTGGPPKADEP